MVEWLQLRDRLATVVVQDGSARRLSKARTTVSFAPWGAAPEVTLLLDRRPAEVTATGSAEVQIELGARAAERFARGELVLATALLEGEARATGPIRRYLAVDPVLRNLLREAAA
ncbi:MAG: hypothetical protein QOF76_5574 [Solirubrobacteraceae bacterium]|jgi:hypothetical protein|nr:hypothetical protein [Solirubrobacteraceae bacterium]